MPALCQSSHQTWFRADSAVGDHAGRRFPTEPGAWAAPSDRNEPAPCAPAIAPGRGRHGPARHAGADLGHRQCRRRSFPRRAFCIRHHAAISDSTMRGCHKGQPEPLWSNASPVPFRSGRTKSCRRPGRSGDGLTEPACPAHGRLRVPPRFARKCPLSEPSVPGNAIA
jgi:hypothetical protein